VTTSRDRAVPADASGLSDERRRLLEETIEREQPELLKDIAFYLFRFGVSTDREGVDATAEDVLQDTSVTAFSILDKYDPDRPAGAWLRGIAVKEILRRRREEGRERGRLTLVGDIGKHKLQELSEAEMFDLLSPPDETNSAGTRSGDELLSLVGEDDRELLRLRHFEGLDGKELAAKLGTSEGAVYQRLSRARKHLRQALEADNKASGGESNA
jgi:RNA polymerase sigma-70 factor (ECF subfamily)